MDRNKSRTYKAQANEIRNRLGERDYVLGLDLGVGSIGIAAIALEKIDGEGPFENLANKLAGINGNGLVGRLIGNAAEGISTVFSGNNLDLPEIWEDSQGGTEHTLVFKLCSPYGDRESIFLYVLRPLARLMAMAFPRQFGPNSYTSPFLIQAFFS